MIDGTLFLIDLGIITASLIGFVGILILIDTLRGKE